MVPTLDVYLGAGSHPQKVGKAHFTLRRGIISTTFSYDPSYLRAAGSYAIDPIFPLTNSAFHCEGLPGAFRDSAPDRWGRNLIARQQRLEAAAAGEPLRSLDEVDYLAGVFDSTREGALRFSMPGGSLLAELGNIPPVIQLPELLAASYRVARDDAGKRQIKELIDAGSSSLGGARPKASVIDGDRLLLAKFSHPGDEWDVMAWEKVALDLAAHSGIAVPASRLVKIGDEAALLLERFDRQASLVDGERLGYMSAMTLLQAQDGQQRDYAEVLEAAAYLVKDASVQLEDLFRRLCLTVVLHNTDDHLRNHGFIHQGHGWVPSPLFDVNPHPYEGKARATTILGRDGSEGASAEAQALKELAAYAGLDGIAAVAVVDDVVRAVSSWRSVVQAVGCRQSEIKIFAPVIDGRIKALISAFDL